MTPLQRDALASTPLSAGDVETLYKDARGGIYTVSRQGAIIRRLCESHERLRAELEGAGFLLDDRPPAVDGVPPAAWTHAGFLRAVAYVWGYFESPETLFRERFADIDEQRPWEAVRHLMRSCPE